MWIPRLRGTLVLCLFAGGAGCLGDVMPAPDLQEAPMPAAGGATPVSKPSAAACARAAGSPPTAARVVRLTKMDLANSLADLVGAAALPSLEIESDALVLGYSTGAGRTVGPTYAEGLKQIASSAAAAFRPTLAAGCAASETSARACTDSFVRDFGKRAFRRPVTDREVTLLLDIYDKGRELAATSAVADRVRSGIGGVVRAMLQAPSFVYRAELGDPAAAGGAGKLTPHETAALLSYTLIASPPDAELLAAADTGGLASADALAAQAERLVTTRPERWKDQVRRFVTEWLAVDFGRADWDKNPAVYKLYTPELKEAFRQELAAFVGDWAAAPTAPLDRLLTSPEVYASKVSAPVYEVSATGTASTRMTVDGGKRAGILTQGAFLGTHAHPDSSAPIDRGLFVRETLFCIPRPQVPPDVPPVPPARAGEARTTRERFESHIQANGGACVACHAQFNPMGYPFESWDGIGKYRTQENGVPVDASGAIVGTPASDRPVADGIELVNALARSRDVHACFARQVFRYTAGRVESDYDACNLVRATQAFTGGGLDVRSLLNALLATDSYSMRAVAKEMP